MANGNGKKNGKPHGNTRYNWHEIEAYYVASNLSYEQLCEKFGCSMSSLATIAAENKWASKREEFRNKIGSEQIEKAKHAVLFDKMQFDAMTERTTDLAAALVAEKFTVEYKRFKAGERSEIDALELKEMMAVVKTAQEIKYRALNIPPPKQTLAVEQVMSPAQALAEELGALGPEILMLLAAEERQNGNGKRKEATA
ncbi:MAG: hypothetical protein HRF49_07590 [bacterium]|jgi:hypothetical protein